MSTAIVGARGEAKVISELTNRGWGVGKPLLDLGIDLLAYKIENHSVRLVAIQVKTLATSSHDNNRRYGAQFDAEHIIDGIFYIIVCLDISEYVIIPSVEIRRKHHWHQDHAEWQRFKNRWELIA